MYEYTDKVMTVLTKKMVREFGKLKKKSVLAFDELNNLKSAVDECYKVCYNAIVGSFYQIARFYYHKAGGEETVITALMIEQFLEKDFDPVTKYLFASEYDRKRARCYEAISITENTAEVDKALRLLHAQVKQWGDNVTDAFTLKAFEDTGIQKVKWKTEEDARVCAECGERDNKIYLIKKVPPKPHPNCRCYLLPVTP